MVICSTDTITIVHCFDVMVFSLINFAMGKISIDSSEYSQGYTRFPNESICLHQQSDFIDYLIFLFYQSEKILNIFITEMQKRSEHCYLLFQSFFQMKQS